MITGIARITSLASGPTLRRSTSAASLAAHAAGTAHAARGSGIPVAAEATAATLGNGPSELVGEPTFPAVATATTGSSGASVAAGATGTTRRGSPAVPAGAAIAEQQRASAAVTTGRTHPTGPAVTDQSRTATGPTVLTGGTRPTVPAIAIQQTARPAGLARPAVGAVADQRPAKQRLGGRIDRIEHLAGQRGVGGLGGRVSPATRG